MEGKPHKKKFRLFEFFIVAGVSDLSQLRDGKAKGEVVAVLPKPSQDEEVLLRDISMFCFPDGVTLNTLPQLPTFFTFVLTDAMGSRMYGSCLIFDEPVCLPGAEAEEAKKESVEKRAPWDPKKARHFLPKCLCVVSRVAFMSLTKKYLATLYATCKQNGFSDSFPLECYIANFLEVPLPPPGKVGLSFSLPGDKVFNCYSPGLHDFPLVDFSFHALFHSLDIDNVLKLLLCALLEKKILLISKHKSLLSISAETLCAIMLPFGWRRVYIPVLSHSLIEYTDAPTPFIMGIHDSFLPHLPELKEVAFVDLDHNRVDIAEKLPEFPEGPKQQLIDKLSYHIHPSLANIDLAFDPREYKSREEDMEFHQHHIRAAFLRFFAAMFADYNHKEKNTSAEEQRFIGSQPGDGREFFERLFATEVWMTFHEERKNETDDVYQDFVNEFRRRPEPLRRIRTVSASGSPRVEESEKRKEGEEGGAEGTASQVSGCAGLVGDVEQQYAFLMKRFGKPDLVFQVPPPKPIYTEDKGSLSIAYGAVPVVNVQSKRKPAALGDVDWRQPIIFPNLRTDTFAVSFVDQTNLGVMIKQLNALIEASPEIMQYYVLRAALYTETKQGLLALKDHDTLWRLMFGYTTFINHNKELMKEIFDLLEEVELNGAANIGTFTRALVDEYRATKYGGFEEEEPDMPGDEDEPNRTKIGSSENIGLALQMQPDIVLHIAAPPDMFDYPVSKSPKLPPAHNFIPSEKGAGDSGANNNPGADSSAPSATSEWELEISMKKMSQFPPDIENNNEKTMTKREFIDFALSGGLTNDYIDAEKLCETLGKPKKVAKRQVQKFLRYLREAYNLSQDTMWSDRLIRGEVVLRISNSSVTNSNGQRGYLVLTNHRLFFSPKKLEYAVEFCKLNEITTVEKYNFKIFIPPGLPCIKVTTRSHLSTETKTEAFCFLSWVERDVWFNYLTEMKGAYDVGTYLDSPILIPLATHRLMLTEALLKLKKKFSRAMLRFLDLPSQKYFRVAKKLEQRGVLNSTYLWEEKMPVRPACVVVEELLHSIISLFLAHVQPDGQSIDFIALTSTADYKRFEKASAELQRVNIKELSLTQRTAFFINTYNALTIHGYIVASTIPCQAVEWRYFSRAACYTIMGLPFSLDIIQHGILRGNRAWPLFAHRPLADGDPRLQWVILATNPIVHFALSTHSESSPYLRIFEAKTLDYQLTAAAEDFLSSTVQVLAKPNRQVILPQVLSTYWRDFGDNDPDKEAPQLIEKWVLPYLSGNKQKLLTSFLQEGGFDVQYYYSWKPEPKPYRQL